MKHQRIFFWLTISIIYLFPLFFIPGLGLVDDAQSLFFSRVFLHLDVNGMAGWFREVSIGRFRPFYILWMAAFGLIGPDAPAVWAVFRCLLLSLTLLLGEAILEPYLRGWQRKAILLTSFLWPAVAANSYRFGTAEPLQLFFLLLTLLSIQRNKLLLSTFSWIATLWSKETSIFFLPVIWWWLWWNGGTNWRRKTLLASLLGALSAVTYLLIPAGLGYSLNVVTDIRHWLHITFIHAPTAWPETYYGLALSLALWAMVFGNVVQRRESLKQFFKMSGFLLCSLFAVLPIVVWLLPQERYLLLVNFFLTVSVGLVTKEWYSRFISVRRPQIWYIAVVVLLSVLIPPTQWLRSIPALSVRSGREIENWLNNFFEQGPLAVRLQNTLVDRLYVETDNEEYAYAIGLYISHFNPESTGLTVVTNFAFPYPIYRQSSSVREAFVFECNRNESCFLLTQTLSVGDGWKTTPVGGRGKWFLVEK